MIASLLSGQLLFAAAVLGALYALIGLGMNLVYGTMRLLNVAHGDILMLGAYAAFWWFTLTTLSPLIALPQMVRLLSSLASGAVPLIEGLNGRLGEDDFIDDADACSKVCSGDGGLWNAFKYGKEIFF